MLMLSSGTQQLLGSRRHSQIDDFGLELSGHCRVVLNLYLHCLDTTEGCQAVTSPKP